MAYKKVYLKPGKEESLKRFHPWVFSGAIQRIEGEPEEGLRTSFRVSATLISVILPSPFKILNDLSSLSLKLSNIVSNYNY